MARLLEYSGSANPVLPSIPVRVFPAELHTEGQTRIEQFDLSGELDCEFPCTTPNLLAGFIRILPGESVVIPVKSTSTSFYVLRGSGKSTWGWGHEILDWHEGDLFVVPGAVTFYHYAGEESAALYFVTDQPLLQYLGVAPCTDRFEYTIFPSKSLRTAVEDIARDGVHRNRLGILLSTKSTERTTRTLTHTLWCLLNKLPAGQMQPPHRHNSVALDLVISAPKHGCYTLLGPELTKDGSVKDPVRVDWVSGSVFTTPPSWWHSHHNETTEDAWVLPVQDAGILTHQRILGIQFKN